jgi:hypothetical protein
LDEQAPPRDGFVLRDQEAHGHGGEAVGCQREEGRGWREFWGVVFKLRIGGVIGQSVLPLMFRIKCGFVVWRTHVE